MHAKFANRTEAGQMLAQRLRTHHERGPLHVIGLARGGVPVAHEIAQACHAPLDVLVVRKLGVPGEEELAFGAIAPAGVCVLNRTLIRALEIRDSEIRRVVERERTELTRREKLLRGTRPPPVLRRETVVLVDDGVATGATMRAAIAFAQAEHAGRVIVAAPVIAREAYLELRDKADEFVLLRIAKEFGVVGDFYMEFPPTSDAELLELLAQPVA